MKRFNRADRLSEELMKEISSIIRNDMKDPRLGKFVSLTRVELSKDLKLAKVFVSIYGPESEKAGTMKALGSGAGFVRGLIGRRMRLRVVPEIVYYKDDSIEYSARIASILKKELPEREDEPEENEENDRE